MQESSPPGASRAYTRSFEMGKYEITVPVTLASFPIQLR
jgi:hypothetical protein